MKETEGETREPCGAPVDQDLHDGCMELPRIAQNMHISVSDFWEVEEHLRGIGQIFGVSMGESNEEIKLLVDHYL